MKRTDLPAGRALRRRPFLAVFCAVLVLVATGVVAAPFRSGPLPAAPPPEASRLLQIGSGAAVPVAVAARVSESGGITRLALDLSDSVQAEAFLLDNPARVVVDLPEVNFQLDPRVGQLAKATGVIRSFRFGLFAPGKSRMVIDLAAPATLRRTEVGPIAAGAPARLVVELARTDHAAFHAAARQEEPAAPLASPDAPPKADAKPVVVIDPGHGGVDPGASGVDGIPEKVIVFDFAQALAAKLTALGRYTVVLTRTDDSFVALGARVKIAREAGAALFISIHADTLSDPAVTGATVYTASERASDAEAARVAATENRADEAAGVAVQPDSQGVNDILFDLTRRETRTYAHLFQRTLVGYWQQIAHLNKNPERAAGFKVLQAPDVPSVLIELGYLSSRTDSKLLTSADWRDKATARIATAVDAFFDPRHAPATQAGSVGVGPVVSVQPHP